MTPDTSAAGLPRQTVDVCICTFRRPEVARSLASVARQTLPGSIGLQVIVVDNDDRPGARAAVLAMARKLSLALTYIHAPARNISIARNACLGASSADWIAFMDDDEEATPGWLMALLDRAALDTADVVFGPVRAIYPPGAPFWMVRNDFHSNIPMRRGERVETGHSCNALIRRAALPPDLRFDPALGQSGGEDTDFFFRLGRSGARLTIAEDALVTEKVGAGRLRLGWLAERRFAEGRHYAASSGRAPLPLALRSLAKAALCAGAALVLTFRPHRAAYWLLRGVFHMGVALGTVHRGQRHAYGR